MKEVTIKSVTWKKEPVSRTKKDFDNGASEFTITPIILVEMPDNYEVFGGSQPDVIMVKERKVVKLSLVGYHIGDKELTFTDHARHEKEFTFKVYSA